MPYILNYTVKFGIAGVGQGNFSSTRQDGYALIDSGSTYTFLLEPVWNELVRKFDNHCFESRIKNVCGGKPNLVKNYCVVYSKSKFGSLKEFYATFPTLNFNLHNRAKIFWFPEDYLFKKYRYWPVYCLSILPENLNNDKSTFGNYFMRHYDIYFNRQRKTISFVRSKCEDKSTRDFRVRGINKLVSDASGSIMQFEYRSLIFTLCLFWVSFCCMQ